MTENAPHQETEFNPPSPQRVAARALVMSTVACRGFVERDANERQFWESVRSWIDALGINDEFEASERGIIEAPLGALEPQQQVDATWLCEGLVVLAWSLGRATLPPYDAPVDVQSVASGLGFLRPRAETVLSSPRLRPAEEIDDMREAIFAIHWRLREYSLRPASLDFSTFANTAWFGPLSLSQARLVDGDLAVGAVPIAHANENERRQCASIIQERHRAAIWLAGYNEVYSEVSTDT